MSDDDDVPSRSLRRLDGEDGSTSAPFPDVEQPSASWSTLQTTLSPDVVRERVVAGVTRFRAAYTLRGIKSGFVVRSTGKRPFIAEVALTGWEEGTQIHITLPRAAKATDRNVVALREFLEAALRWDSRG
jgi:hypothetical protein